MTVSWETFVPEVEKHVVAPWPMLIESIRDAAIMFCEKTRIVRENLDPIDSVVDQRSYNIAPADTTNTRIVTVISGQYDDRPIYPLTEEFIDHAAPYSRTLGGIYYGYRLDSPTVLTLTFDPSEVIEDAIVLRVATKPTVDSSLGDDTLYYDYRDDIAAGAVLRLLSSPGVHPWKKGVSATTHKGLEAQWNAAIGDAAWQAYKGRTTGDVRVKKRRFS